jgi:hypothetical protein
VLRMVRFVYRLEVVTLAETGLGDQGIGLLAAVRHPHLSLKIFEGLYIRECRRMGRPCNMAKRILWSHGVKSDSPVFSLVLDSTRGLLVGPGYQLLRKHATQERLSDILGAEEGRDIQLPAAGKQWT